MSPLHEPLAVPQFIASIANVAARFQARFVVVDGVDPFRGTDPPGAIEPVQTVCRQGTTPKLMCRSVALRRQGENSPVLLASAACRWKCGFFLNSGHL